MDLAVTLIKSVMRAFYPIRDILVVDALILHETLRDDDLAYLMAINTKDLHKICGKLREDRFLTVHTRQELRPGNPRPSNRTWYYINYRHTIDAIKWRVYTIDKEVQGSSVTINEKEYFCPVCKAEWTAMEVLDNVGPNGFLCHRCHHTLIFEADRNSGGHEQSTRLNDQFKFIGELLPKIDAVHIPDCDFDRDLAKARPVTRDASYQRATTIAVDTVSSRPMPIKGLTNTGPQSIAVNISVAEGPSEIEKDAERARKENIARQNALPNWMSNSTVTGESFAGAAEADAAIAKSVVVPGTASGKLEERSSTSAKIDDIFEKLKADQELQKGGERLAGDGIDGDFGPEEEEEHEFEDVPATGHDFVSGLSNLTGIKRRGGSQDDLLDADTRVEKRVKMEPERKTNGSVEDDEDEEDEEVEFEDV